MQKSESKIIESYLKGYRMYLKDGQVVVSGNGKFKAYVALFNISEVRDLVKP
jgi:hypothetical protein